MIGHFIVLNALVAIKDGNLKETLAIMYTDITLLLRLTLFMLCRFTESIEIESDLNYLQC